MGYLEIPVIDVRLGIYHGTGENVLKNGVGHLKNTSLPIGGEEHTLFFPPMQDFRKKSFLQT